VTHSEAGKRASHPKRRTGAARDVTDAEVALYARRVARRIRDLRLERGINQGELARAAGIGGGASEVGDVERVKRRKRGPSLYVLIRIARALGVDPSELLA